MSRMNEFRVLAERYGPASIRDHISNYFEKTGRPSHGPTIRSVMSQVNRELKPGGALFELGENGTILPSIPTSGTVPGWTEGKEPVEDKKTLVVVPTDAVTTVKDLVKKSNFQDPSTDHAVSVTVERAERQTSLTGQRDALAGLTSTLVEGLLKDKDLVIASNQIADKDRQIADANARAERDARIIDLLSNLLPENRSLSVIPAAGARRPTTSNSH